MYATRSDGSPAATLAAFQGSYGLAVFFAWVYGVGYFAPGELTPEEQVALVAEAAARTLEASAVADPPVPLYKDDFEPDEL